MTKGEQQKRAAGYEAAGLVESGMMIGLGTGSTVRYLLEALSERLRSGDLKGVIGVSTSEATTRQALALNISLTDLSGSPRIDLAIDGADEVGPDLNLIKGLGGALLREKVVATAAARFVVLVDESKLVDRLGRKAPLPVEVDPFSVGIQIPFLDGLGARPVLRLGEGGAPYRTDGGHFIIDCHFEHGISDPVSLASALDGRVGILEHGLFLNLAERVLVGGQSGVRTIFPEHS